MENLRAQWHDLNEEVKKVKSEKNMWEYKALKLEEELTTLKQKSTYANFQLRMMEEINEQNKELQEEKSKLREEIEEIKAKKSEESKVVSHEITDEIKEKLA